MSGAGDVPLDSSLIPLPPIMTQDRAPPPAHDVRAELRLNPLMPIPDHVPSSIGMNSQSHAGVTHILPRSQAHETLGTMTTVIMRTSDDNRPRSFSALFQGFHFLGNLPVTLVFHEAPTVTQE